MTSFRYIDYDIPYDADEIFINTDALESFHKRSVYRKDRETPEVQFDVPPLSKLDLFFDESSTCIPFKNRGGSNGEGVFGYVIQSNTEPDDIESYVKQFDRQMTFVNTEIDKTYPVAIRYPLSNALTASRTRPLRKSDTDYDIDFGKINITERNIPVITRDKHILSIEDQIDFATKQTKVPKVYMSYLNTDENMYVDAVDGRKMNISPNGEVYDVPNRSIDIDVIHEMEGIWMPSGYTLSIKCNNGESTLYGPYDVGILFDVRMFPTNKITELSFDISNNFTKKYMPIFDRDIIESVFSPAGQSLLSLALTRNVPCILENNKWEVKFMDKKNKYMSSGINTDKLIGLLVPPHLSIHINKESPEPHTIGPFSEPWLLPVRGNEPPMTIDYTDTLLYDEVRGNISASLSDEYFFISDQKPDDESKDESSIEQEPASTCVQTLNPGERCKVSCVDASGDTFHKSFGPYSNKVYVYKSPNVSDKWNKDDNITVESKPSLFQSLYPTRKTIVTTVMFEDLYPFYKGAVLTDNSELNSPYPCDFKTAEYMEDSVKFRFQLKDTPQAIDQIKGIKNMNLFLPKKNQIMLSDGKNNFVIIGPFANDCKFKLDQIKFTPTHYRLFEFGQAIDTVYARDNVVSCAQTKFFAERNISFWSDVDQEFPLEILPRDIGTWKGSIEDGTRIHLPRGVELKLSNQNAGNIHSYCADTSYGPFDCDTIIDPSMRFTNTQIELTWNENTEYICRPDILIGRRVFSNKRAFGSADITYTRRGTTEIFTHTIDFDPDTGFEDMSKTIFKPGDVLEDDVRFIESVYIPPNFCCTIVTKKCMLDIKREEEPKIINLIACNDVIDIVFQYDPEVPFSVHKPMPSVALDANDTETTVFNYGVSELKIQRGEVVYIKPIYDNDYETYGDFTLGPYLQSRVIDLSKSILSTTGVRVNRIRDHVTENIDIQRSIIVSKTDPDHEYSTIKTDKSVCKLFESLSPTTIHGNVLEKITLEPNCVFSLFTETGGHGFYVTYNITEWTSIKTLGTPFESAKSYTFFKPPQMFLKGVESVDVKMDTGNENVMTTADSWNVETGLKNGYECENPPRSIDCNGFMWEFIQPMNFFGFKCNDSKVLEKAQNDELVIDVHTPAGKKMNCKYSTNGDWVMLCDINREEDPQNKYYEPSGSVSSISSMCPRDIPTETYGSPFEKLPKDLKVITSSYNYTRNKFTFNTTHAFETISRVSRLCGGIQPGEDGISNPIEHNYVTIDFYNDVEDSSAYGSIVYDVMYDNTNDMYFYNGIASRSHVDNILHGPEKTDLVTIEILSTSGKTPSPAQWSNLRLYYVDDDFTVKFVDTNDIDIENVENPGGENNLSDEYYEGPSSLFDNNLKTKWLDTQKDLSGLMRGKENLNLQYTPTLKIPLKKPLTIVGIDADSAGDFSERDPEIVRVNGMIFAPYSPPTVKVPSSVKVPVKSTGKVPVKSTGKVPFGIKIPAGKKAPVSKVVYTQINPMRDSDRARNSRITYHRIYAGFATASHIELSSIGGLDGERYLDHVLDEKETYLPNAINDRIQYESQTPHDEQKLLLQLKPGTKMSDMLLSGANDAYTEFKEWNFNDEREPGVLPLAFISRVKTSTGDCMNEDLYVRTVDEDNEYKIRYTIPTDLSHPDYSTKDKMKWLFENISCKSFDVIVTVVLGQRKNLPFNGCVQMNKLDILYYDPTTRRVEILDQDMIVSVHNRDGRSDDDELVDNLFINNDKKWCDQNFEANGKSRISISVKKPILIIGVNMVTSVDFPGRDPKALEVVSDKSFTKFRCLDDGVRNRTFFIEQVPWGIFKRQ